MTAREDAVTSLVNGGYPRQIAREIIAAVRAEAVAEHRTTPLVVSRYDVAMEPAPEEEPVFTVGAVAEDGRPVALCFDAEARARVAGWLAPPEPVVAELMRQTRMRLFRWIASRADDASGPDWMDGQGYHIAAWMRRMADVLVEDGANVPADVQQAAARLALLEKDPHAYGPVLVPLSPEPAAADALPHDPYITAVVDALTAVGLEPSDWHTDDTETDPYDTGEDAGCSTMLTAVIEWHSSTEHENGIALVWEHPAEQWQWAPRGTHGVLEHEPEFLPLYRWADPAAVVDVVPVLLAGLKVPGGQDPRLWSQYVAASEAIAAWSATADHIADTQKGIRP